MKVSLFKQFFGFDNKPLDGRITVFVHNTNTRAEVFTLEGNDFVPATNPMELDDTGTMPETLFMEAGIYDVLVEKDNGDGTWSYRDRFETGLDVDLDKVGRAFVGSIEELASLDPSIVNKFVQVNPTDGSPSRLYVWDPDSNDTQDGGYVVHSDMSGTGNWILLWGDEVLPSSIYGVRLGNWTNMSSLLHYPREVGSFRLVTAPIVRIERGTYDSTLTYSTDKELWFDPDAVFTAACFEVPRCRMMGERTGYCADFYFTNPAQEAHSSWFRTVMGFWRSNATKFVLDDTDYFADRRVTGVITLTNKIVEGTKRLNQTYQNGAYFVLSNTDINGKIFAPSTDYVQLGSNSYGDEIFTAGSFDAGLISAGHHVQYNYAPDLNRFANTTWWVLVMTERKARFGDLMTELLDLQNRNIQTLNPGIFTDIRNVYCDTMNIQNQGKDVTLRNCRVEKLYAACRYLSTEDCVVDFPMEPNITAFWGTRGSINASYPFSATSKQYVFADAYVGISFKRPVDNKTDEAFLQFTNCRFQENVVIWAKRIIMVSCVTKNNQIKIYPYKDNENKYHLFARFENNFFDNSAPIEFTKFDGGDMSVHDECYDCIADWTFVGNTFMGNDEGIRCRYWSNRVGSHYNATFIKWGADSAIIYDANVGKCPADNASGVSMTNGSGCEDNFYWVELGDDHYATLDKRYPARIVPDLNSAIGKSTPYHWGVDAINGNGLQVRTRYTGNDNSDFNMSLGSYIYPWSHAWSPVENGDFFLYGFCRFGKVTENDPSYYPWTWRFLHVS